jgi:hypothetical protein
MGQKGRPKCVSEVKTFENGTVTVNGVKVIDKGIPVTVSKPVVSENKKTVTTVKPSNKAIPSKKGQERGGLFVSFHIKPDQPRFANFAASADLLEEAGLPNDSNNEWFMNYFPLNGNPKKMFVSAQVSPVDNAITYSSLSGNHFHVPYALNDDPRYSTVLEKVKTKLNKSGAQSCRIPVELLTDKKTNRKGFVIDFEGVA